MQISRMDLDDAGANPQRIAEAIIAQIPDLPRRVPVEEIAYALDIVEISVEPLKSFEGVLITSGPEKTEGSILVNAKSGLRRRRYTVGHELGHFLHPHHIPPTDGFHCTSEDMARSNVKGNSKRILQELQANAFAAELLLPRVLFVRDLQYKRELGLEAIIELSDNYDISKEAVARRYVSLQEEACAIVFSHEGRIRYFCRHDNFPWLDIRSGSPVPGESTAAKPEGKAGMATNWAVVDAGIWLSSPGRRALCEQTLLQQGGYRMTLLALDDANGEEEDEDMLGASWTPRFQRR